MNRYTKEMRERVEMAKDAGLEVLAVKRHRRHMKIEVRNGYGITTTVVAPVSGSDWRGDLNLAALFRRIAGSATPVGKHNHSRGDKP